MRSAVQKSSVAVRRRLRYAEILGRRCLATFEDVLLVLVVVCGGLLLVSTDVNRACYARVAIEVCGACVR